MTSFLCIRKCPNFNFQTVCYVWYNALSRLLKRLLFLSLKRQWKMCCNNYSSRIICLAYSNRLKSLKVNFVLTKDLPWGKLHSKPRLFSKKIRPKKSNKSESDLPLYNLLWIHKSLVKRESMNPRGIFKLRSKILSSRINHR